MDEVDRLFANSVYTHLPEWGGFSIVTDYLEISKFCTTTVTSLKQISFLVT